MIEWNYVLTAAHCINQQSTSLPGWGKDVVVNAGIIQIQGDRDEQKQTVTKDKAHIIMHPEWTGVNGRPMMSDIGNAYSGIDFFTCYAYSMF